jgi:hypothetical protein
MVPRTPPRRGPDGGPEAVRAPSQSHCPILPFVLEEIIDEHRNRGVDECDCDAERGPRRQQDGKGVDDESGTTGERGFVSTMNSP